MLKCQKTGKEEGRKEYMIFDTHAHYDDEAFNEDRDELLGSLSANGIEAVVNISSDLESIDATLKLTRQYPQVYGAAGIHPCDTEALNEENFEHVCTAAADPRIVAVGEIGLDYYWDKARQETQKYWFERQLELAREVKRPVVIHSREAAKDTLDIMKAHKSGEIGGVIHCFSYGTEMAREYLNMGFYLGIGGVLTFNNAKKLKEVAAYAPLDRLVLETDCPYLSPVPFRGKRNSSLNLPYVVKAMAELKGLTEAEIILATNRNAKALYRLALPDTAEK